MWICGNCGRPVRDDRATACTHCNSVKGMRRPAASRPAAGSTPSDPAARTPSASNPSAASAPVSASPAAKAPVAVPPAPPVPPAPRVKLGERPLVTMAKRLARQPKFWIALASVLVVVVAVPWLGLQLSKWASRPVVKADPTVVEPALKKDFEKLVDQALTDKLEWGREVLRNRLPTRFPEELVMEVDKQKSEVKYDSRKKNTVNFHILISYHFEDDHPKTRRWYPATFFFRKQDQKWYLTGDNWIKESELIFE